MSTTLDRVIPIVAKQLGRDASEFNADTDLQEAGYESLDVIETIFAIEEEFGIDINFNANVDDADNMKRISDLVVLIDKALAKKGTQ